MKLFSLFFILTPTLSFPLFKIQSYSNTNAANLINEWINIIKNNNMPLYNLYPTYTTAGHLTQREKKIEQIDNENQSFNDVLSKGIILIHKEDIELPFSIEHKKFEINCHILLADIEKKTEEKPKIKIKEIIRNPTINILTETTGIKDLDKVSVKLKKSLNKYVEKYDYSIDTSELKKWDNGRYYLMMDEDVYFGEK